MSVTTGTSGIDNTGIVTVYTPPTVTAVPKGSSVSYGTYQPYSAGEILSPIGIIQIANASGQLLAIDEVTVRTVTITAPTGTEGEDAA